MTRIRIVLAWVLLVGSVIGLALTNLGLIAQNEPRLVLDLSWAALIYEGFNATQIAHDSKG